MPFAEASSKVKIQGQAEKKSYVGNPFPREIAMLYTQIFHYLAGSLQTFHFTAQQKAAGAYINLNGLGLRMYASAARNALKAGLAASKLCIKLSFVIRYCNIIHLLQEMVLHGYTGKSTLKQWKHKAGWTF